MVAVQHARDVIPRPTADNAERHVVVSLHDGVDALIDGAVAAEHEEHVILAGAGGGPHHLLALALPGLKAFGVDAQTGGSQQIDGSLLVGGGCSTVSVLVHEQISPHPFYSGHGPESSAVVHSR